MPNVPERFACIRLWRVPKRFDALVVPWALLVASDALWVLPGVPWQTRFGKALINVFSWRRAYCMRRNFLLVGVDSAVFTNFFGVLRRDRQAFGPASVGRKQLVPFGSAVWLGVPRRFGRRTTFVVRTVRASAYRGRFPTVRGVTTPDPASEMHLALEQWIAGDLESVRATNSTNSVACDRFWWGSMWPVAPKVLLTAAFSCTAIVWVGANPGWSSSWWIRVPVAIVSLVSILGLWRWAGAYALLDGDHFEWTDGKSVCRVARDQIECFDCSDQVGFWQHKPFRITYLDRDSGNSSPSGTDVLDGSIIKPTRVTRSITVSAQMGNASRAAFGADVQRWTARGPVS